MTLKANKNGTWVGGDDQSQGTVMYGKSAGNWLYAKSVWAKKDGVWARAWTDCRRHDAGGRDWGTTTLSAVYSGSCGNRTYQIPTRYTKDGCPSYDVAGSTVSSPDCNSGCFTASSVDCAGCGSATLYTANSGSGCTTYTTGSCGSWTSYFDFVTIQLNNGQYVTGTIWGWLYSDSAGTANASCSGGSGLVGPENVDSCSVGGYRKTGTDQCVIISCC